MLAGVLLCGALNAQSIKVTNTFGGDSDNISGSDLFVFENQKDMFKKRIEKIGFGDMFQKYNLNLKL